MVSTASPEASVVRKYPFEVLMTAFGTGRPVTQLVTWAVRVPRGEAGTPANLKDPTRVSQPTVLVAWLAAV